MDGRERMVIRGYFIQKVASVQKFTGEARVLGMKMGEFISG